MEFHGVWNLGVNGEINRPVADAEALVGSLLEQSLLVEKEKAVVLSIPSLSSVPSTILQSKYYNISILPTFPQEQM